MRLRSNNRPARSGFTRCAIEFILLVVLLCGCGDSKGAAEPVADTGKGTADVLPDAADVLPDADVDPTEDADSDVEDTSTVVSRLQLVERAGVGGPGSVVSAGVPLPNGAARTSEQLAIVELDGTPLPSNFSVRSRWSNGSIRWVHAVIDADLAPNESRTVQLVLNQDPPLDVDLVVGDLPAMRIEATTDNDVGSVEVALTSQSLGDLLVETDIEPLGSDAALVRVHVAQLNRDTFWNELSLTISGVVTDVDDEQGAATVGGWAVALRDFANRSPTSVRSNDDGLVLDLYPASAPPYPADEGFHVAYELLLVRGATTQQTVALVARPSVITWPAGYIASTGAMGPLAPPNPDLDAALERSLARLQAQRELPINRTWTSWGDFYDGEHGLAYLGFLAQEYDPATAMMLYYARTGNLAALDLGLSMARQYADQGVALHGGSYQHRATLHALQGRVAEVVGAALREAWRTNPNTPATDEEMIAYARANYGEDAADGLAEVLAENSTSDPTERERNISELVGYSLALSGEEEVTPDELTALTADPPDVRVLADVYLTASVLGALTLPDSDTAFAPFFARYGGAWTAFPAFHRYDLPDIHRTHAGGHSLGEMLVWAHLLSGNQRLLRAALTSARWFVEQVVPRQLQRFRSSLADTSAEGDLFLRELGWPLVTLEAYTVLTEDDPELHANVLTTIENIVTFLVTIPPQRYQGAIHVGVVGEGLARYHHRTGNPAAGDALVALMTYWSQTQWSDAAIGFNYIHNEPQQFETLSLFCYMALAYAAEISGNSELAERAAALYGHFPNLNDGYAKSVGQAFHNTQRW